MSGRGIERGEQEPEFYDGISIQFPEFVNAEEGIVTIFSSTPDMEYDFLIRADSRFRDHFQPVQKALHTGETIRMRPREQKKGDCVVITMQGSMKDGSPNIFTSISMFTFTVDKGWRKVDSQLSL